MIKKQKDYCVWALDDHVDHLFKHSVGVEYLRGADLHTWFGVALHFLGHISRHLEVLQGKKHLVESLMIQWFWVWDLEMKLGPVCWH